METSRKTLFASVATILSLLLAAVYAAVAQVPEGYEAPITFYFACCLITLTLSVYTLSLRKNRRNTLLTIGTLACIILFFGLNLKDRRLTRWVERFPDDPVVVGVSDVLSLPVIAYQYVLTQLNLSIPWFLGLATSILLLLLYWAYSSRLLQRMGLHVTSETSDQRPTDAQDRSRNRGVERAGVLFLALIAASIRILPTLSSRVPAGVDTPFYVAALQGRLPPDWFGGSLRQLLYFLFRVIGIALYLPFPTPLHQIWAVNAIPIIFHAVNAVLIYNLAKSCFKDPETGILASIFLATSTGMLRITWDLYKLLLSIPFALLSAQQLAKSIELRDRRHGLLGLSFLAITVVSHATLGGIAFLAISSFVLVKAILSKGFFSRSRWIVYSILALIILPSLLGDLLGKMLFSGWYSGNFSGPLPRYPEVGIISLSELFRWLGITPLLLAALGILNSRRGKGCETLPQIWLVASFLLIEQALFHTYTQTGQISRVELLTSIPVAIVAARGTTKITNPLRQVRERKIGIPLNMIAILILILSNLTVAWGYGGFLSGTMINEPEYLSMTWLINYAPYTNCGVPQKFDSWTGYYGQIQNPRLPTTFYIDRTATDNSPLYDRVYSGFNRIYVRTDLI